MNENGRKRSRLCDLSRTVKKKKLSYCRLSARAYTRAWGGERGGEGRGCVADGRGLFSTSYDSSFFTFPYLLFCLWMYGSSLSKLGSYLKQFEKRADQTEIRSAWSNPKQDG